MSRRAAGQPPGTDRYTITRELGVGGMGVVYEAVENASGARVALKLLPAVDPHALFGFKNEFRSLAALVHPNLVSLYELVADDDRWFFTMELVDGGDFLHHVRRTPVEGNPAPRFEDAVDEAKLRAALLQLAEGVHALHLNQVLHRDLKPPNVLVRRDGRVAILDFGLAVALGEKLNTRERSAGTLAYMSPEQLGGDPIGPPADWYAVGVMLYEALTGRPPFGGGPQAMFFAKMSGSVAPPCEVAAGVPDDLNTLCMELLRPDPESRLTGEELLQRLGSPTVAAHPRVDTGTKQFRLFIGREDLLARLDAAKSAAQHGATVTAYVHGRSGAGKSALLEQFLADARVNDDVVVFAGRCYEQESVPFKAVDTIVDALTRWLIGRDDVDQLLPADIAALARIFPVLERVEAIADAPRDALTVPDPREVRRRAFGALRDILVRIGGRSPLIVAIDDLQWGDVDSAELLASVLESPGAPRLLFVAAFRSEYRDSSPCLRALTSGLATTRHRMGAHDEIEVDALDAEKAALLAGALLTTRSDAVAARIATESGGNPFFIQELARYANEHPGWSARPDAGVFDLERVLWSRVERLPAPARAMLELIAIAGQPVRNAHWRDAIEGLTVDPQSVALLRFEHLIRSTGSSSHDEVETYHDRIRETVSARLESPVRVAHHRRLALSMASHGDADHETVAVHFAAGGDRDRAGAHYAHAARYAERALAFDRAAKLYEQSLEHRPGSGAERRDLLAALGSALANAGRGRRAAEAYERAAGLATDDTRRLDLQRRAASQYCTSGHIDQGRQLFDDVMRGVGLRPVHSSALIIGQLMGRRALLRLRGLGHVPRSEEQVPPELLRRLDTLWAVSTSLSNVDVVGVAALQSQALLLALKAGEPRRLALALAWESVLNATAGTKAAPRSNELLQVARSLVASEPAPHAHGMMSLSAGWVAFLHARFPDALALCDEAEPVFREQCTGVWWELTTTRTMIAWGLAHTGRARELASRIAAWEPEGRTRGDHFMVTNLLAYPMPFERMMAGDAQGAREHLREALALWPYRGFHIQHVSVLFSQALLSLFSGDGQGACHAVTSQWPAMVRSLQTQNQQTRVMLRDVRARGALAAAASSFERDRNIARAESDLRAIERERAGWTDAYAHRIRAGLRIVRGDVESATAALRASIPGLEAAGMSLQGAAVRRRLGQLIGGDEGRAMTATGDAMMRDAEIADPEAVTRMYVAG